MASIAVVGGGISGLAAAHRILELDPTHDVHVFESTSRPGGWIRSETIDRFVIERGPDAILTEKRAAIDLAVRVGLASDIVSTRESARGAYVVAHGKLEKIPEGFSLLAPTSFPAFLRSPILSPRGKARALFDLVLPRGPRRDDESLASFVERRFGRELLDRLAQPLVSGIYGADASRLSLRATMPRFLDLEASDRSVIVGLRRSQARRPEGRSESGARYGLFASFRKGMQMLPDAVARVLGDRVHLGATVRGIERHASGFRLRLDETTQAFDAVIVATPAYRSAELLASIDSELSALLAQIEYGSAATTTFVWPRRAIPHPLDASGFIVPVIEKRDVLASTFASVKWPGRAPDDEVIVRVFHGGPGKEDLVAREDDGLLDDARRELRALMGITAEPSLVRVDRFARAMPRYEVGHLERVAAIDGRIRAVPGLSLAGNAYRGVGIPDAVRSGETAAESIVETLRNGR